MSLANYQSVMEFNANSGAVYLHISTRNKKSTTTAETSRKT